MAEIAQPGVRIGAASRRSPLRLSPANIVLLASGALILVVFGVFALLCWQAYDSVLGQARVRVQTAADVLATQETWIMSSGLAVLNQVAAQVAADPGALGGLTTSPAAAAARSLPAQVSLVAYDAAGKLMAGAGSAQIPADLSDRPDFQRLATGENWMLSRQIPGASKERPIFALAKRLVSNGRFVGIAALVYDAGLLQRLWEPQQLGPESTISIVRDDGWIVARYPALPQPMDLSKTAIFPTLTASENGSYFSPASPADGVARVVAFRHMPQFHFITIASMGRDRVLAELWTSIITVLWLLGPIALALMVGAVLTANLLRRSEQQQTRLTAALAHNDVLFREIHHRVKNNLQSVASLLQMQPIAREIKIDMGQRIAAMAAVHEHIYRSSDFSTVMVKEYLSTLIGNIRAGAGERVQVSEAIEDLPVDKDAATPLGLIVNEVVANAFKHAFPDGREGTVRVELTRQEDGRGRLVVSDDGVGFDPAAPAKGIGQRLIKALTAQLGGESTLTSGPGGSTFVLMFPLAKAG